MDLQIYSPVISMVAKCYNLERARERERERE